MKTRLLNLYNNNNNTLFMLALMVIIIPFAGELKLYPFNESFRISFGMPAFFFFLLIWRNNRVILAGIVVGIAVVFFRMLIDIPISDLTSSFIRHYPTFFYYLSFSCLFQISRIKQILHLPLIAGLIGVLLDIIASSTELAVQYLALESQIQFDNIYNVTIIAIFRSFFIVGLYNLIILHNTRLKKEQVQLQNRRLILLITELYQETINLNKTLINSEKVTEKSYNLYKSLKDIDNISNLQKNLSKTALEITGESHEIKKDNQRILSSLSKLISEESFSEYMSMNAILDIAINSNKNYAATLEKEITFSQTIEHKDAEYHVYITLSLINNLLANAVEAIENKGNISLNVFYAKENIIFQIKDDGLGVKDSNAKVIFEPGFTTKYDINGSASTGIGLSYVQSLVEKLDGAITIENNANLKGVMFTVTLPEISLTRKEDLE